MLALRERIFTLVQFATYTYAQNVVHSFVAPKKSLNAKPSSSTVAVIAE
jgi:hypothetical protein